MAHGVQVLPADAHNAELVSQVHPPDWQNPTPAGRYHLVVIGGGTAGLVTAAGAAGLGARVALIERELLGGDCLNVGCVPSKALIRASRCAAEVRDAGRFGVEVPAGVRVDFGAVMERMRRLRAGLSPHDSAARFRELGVDVFLGTARFAGPDSIEVEGQTLRFHRAVLATGARAARPSIPGLAETGFLTNETIFSLTELPPRLAVIGAGPIGCELAQAFARFGSHVSLLDHGPQIIPREDRDAAQRVESALVKDRVQLLLNSKVTVAQRAAEGITLQFQRESQSGTLMADAVLVATGRAPNVEGLNLEAVGVQYDPRKGVEVNARLQTSNPRIYAAGDVCSQYKFTHAADAMARIVVQNALFRGRAKVTSLTIPWCTYTDPEIAHVGLSEAEADWKGIAIDTFTQELNRVDRAVLDGQDHGFVKVHVRRGTDRIVGGTIVAAHAGEMISELTLAMTANLGLKQLGRTIHPYPTQAEALKKIADAYSRTRLTPLVKSIIGKWLSLFPAAKG